MLELDSNPAPLAPPAPPSFATRVFRAAARQAWVLSVAYLLIGSCAELLRRLGGQLGAVVQSFLDSLPLLVIRHLGLLELYLSAVAIGRISPFWNRVLLSSITLALIALQALLVGACVFVALRIRAGRRR